MDTINRAFAEVMIEGDVKGRVFTFPIPTYNITADFDWDNPNLEAVWKMTGKYGIPYFSNFVNSDMSPEDARSMCCRLRLDNRELFKRGGGLFGANPLTGSIGVVTINLPRIGYLSENEDDFFRRLKEMMLLAKESLSIKRKVLEKFTDKSLYPYSKFYLREIKQGSGLYWKNHFSTIGIVGMNEACLNFLGTDIASETGQMFSLKVLDFMREMISEIQEETGDIFNLEATPAEGTSYRLSMIDKKMFPRILCANEEGCQNGGEPFYTNSTQLPVNYTDDIFETLTLQDQLQTKYTGGTVLHIYLGEEVTDIETVKGLIKKVVTNFRLPYLTLSPTFSVCPSHGYLSGEQQKCPICDEETEIYSRVVGYLRPTKQWNSGKQAEFGLRKTFKVA
jgi:ribonucleoside-triphosphate reductase